MSDTESRFMLGCSASWGGTRTVITMRLTAIQAEGLVVRRGLRAGRRVPASSTSLLEVRADTPMVRAKRMRRGNPYSAHTIGRPPGRASAS